MEKTYDVWWDDTLGLIRLKSTGTSDEQIARGTADAIRAQRKEHGDTVDMLLDLTEATGASGKARKIYADVSKEGTGRSAFFGTSMVLRVIVNLIFGAAGASDRMKQFATEEEALTWLKN